MRRAAKRDRNEPEIIAALRLVDASVLQVSSPGAPDLLVGWGGRNHLLEVKMPGERMTMEQALVDSIWDGDHIHIVTTPREALLAIGVPWPMLNVILGTYPVHTQDEVNAKMRARRAERGPGPTPGRTRPPRQRAPA